MRITSRNVDTFLTELPEPARTDMLALDALITDIFSNAPRVMWEGVFWGGTEQSIIGYGDLWQPRPKGESVHWFVVGLALQKAGISIYVNAVKDGQYIGKSYGTRLGKVKIGAASIGFRKLAALDLEVLREMLIEAKALTA
ncbi:MAG: hypothetical protein M9953_13320 [Thermomicrobiales bacterium]|nr:hypothetical protein [Thermomicrobiales bacterium]MCO5226312.1 hypothetical protein [Thermomicrobiales bacterium]MCO5228843.1 hypothetical protein [Thermomicrobiales bacterium]